MFDKRFFLTMITMLALAYGILEVKTILHDNFIDHDTPVKRALNSFLNGEIKK